MKLTRTVEEGRRLVKLLVASEWQALDYAKVRTAIALALKRSMKAMVWFDHEFKLLSCNAQDHV